MRTPGATALPLAALLLLAGPVPRHPQPRWIPFRPVGSPPGPARFYANMPFSIDVGAGAPHFTAQHIAEDDNLVAFHMDWFGIPWQEFASGAPLPRAWLAEMERMTALKGDLQLPVYLAITPIGGNRDRLAARSWGEGSTLFQDDSFGSPCEPISARADAAAIRVGFHAYVNDLVERFEPKFLALSIEVNMYARRCPSAWNDMRALLNAEYAAQKALHPEMPVFHTFQVEELWEASEPTSRCFGYRRECLTENLAALSDLETDLLALSVYPIAPYDNNGRVLPDDYLSTLGALTGKSVAVSETGFPADTISGIVSGQCVPGLPSSPADQTWWMSRLLADAEKLRMPFVVWWANHAPLPFESLRPCWCTEATVFCDYLSALPDDQVRMGIRFFGLMALRDYDGTPQPALVGWRQAVSAALAPDGSYPSHTTAGPPETPTSSLSTRRPPHRPYAQRSSRQARSAG